MKKTITFLSTRAAMMLLATLLLTLTAQTAWADDPLQLPAADGEGNVTITTHGTYEARGTIEGNLIIDTSGEVILNVGELNAQNIELHSGTLTLYVHDGSHINAQDIPYVTTLYMDGGEITCQSIGFYSGTVSGGTINALAIGAVGTISGGTLTATGRFVAGVDNYPTAYDLTITGGAISAPIFDILRTTTITADNASLSITADTYDDYWGYALTLDGTRSLIDAGDFNNIYDPGVLSVSAIAGKTLRPAYTVTFDENGGSAVSDLTVPGGSTISDPGSTKTGYTATWKKGEDVYNFSTPVTSDFTLTADWTANTYTVHFDANGGSGEMADMNLTYDGDYATLTAFGFTAPEGKAFKNWNTAEDGSGASYDNEEWVRNLTTENGATVTLYAQWAEDIANCDITVPDQVVSPAGYSFDNIYYKFSYAKESYSFATDLIEEMDVVVKDGNTVLALGTDYTYGSVTLANGNPIGDKSYPGDKCRVEIKGKGDYAGSKWAYFMVTTPDAADTWDNLAWSFHAGTLTITGTGAMNPTSRDQYPWFSIADYIKTVTLDEGITSIAASAFAGTQNVHSYGNLATLNLPSTLTEIGENAFAYCVGLSIDLADLNGIEYPASAFSYIGSITGTLYDKADNSKAVTMMWQAGTNDVTITDRTLYKDGYWNTICLPFDVKADNALLTGATVKELDLNGYYDDKRTGFDEQSGSLYLFFQTPTADGNDVLLKAGTPYLIKWPSGENSTSDLTFNGVKVISSPLNITSKDNKVSFIGNFSPVTLTADNDETDLYLGGNNKLYWPSSDKPMNSFRAYFHVDLSNPSGGGQAPELKIVLNFGEDENTTAINEHESHESHELSGAWYSLDGRKLDGKPTAKGLYIVNGRKVVIK